MKKIFLIGNPNVGKSLIFCRLTGTDVIISNYPGTTIEFYKGHLKKDNQIIEVVDLPGTYTLQPTNKAEEVVFNILEELKNKNEDFVIVNVIDATNLERNLNLTFQLIKKHLPMIVLLNMWDETKHKGIIIDYKKLEEILGIPVIPTCARTSEGINEFVSRLNEAKVSNFDYNEEQKWQKIGEVVSQVQKLTHKHHTFLDRLSEITIKPSTGIPFALFVLISTFAIVRFLGENFTSVLDNLFNKFYLPFITTAVSKLIPIEFLQKILLGSVTEPMEGFGVLTTGLYIPLVVVFPYLFSFYLVLSILEDIGYIPRLAVMLDSFLHRLGIHGYASVPVLLGLGCKVPGIFALRLLETEKEKFLTSVLLLMIAPCMPQTSMILALSVRYGIKYAVFIFLVLFFVSVFVSFILNKVLNGETTELFVEIPPYRMIDLSLLLKKLYIRMKEFFADAVPLIILGIFIINILDVLGVVKIISETIGTPLSFLLNLPKEISIVLISGFLRKDVSISLLSPFDLTAKQFVVASIFLVLYLPCVSTFFTLVKEQGIKNGIKILVLMLFIAFLISFIVNLIL
jgi:ferrous iron transport protein B